MKGLGVGEAKWTSVQSQTGTEVTAIRRLLGAEDGGGRTAS